MSEPKKYSTRRKWKVYRPSAQELAFCRAAQENDIQALQQLLADGVDVNCAPYGSTILAIAVIFGSPECVRILISSGADANLTHGRGTPLISALMRSVESIVRLLIDAGADVNLVNDAEFGQAPLQYAAEFGLQNCLQALIDAGADVNHVNKNGWTALMSATARDQLACLTPLIEAGADLNHATNHEGWTALTIAVRKGYLTCAQELLSAGADVNYVDNAGRTALVYAARSWSVMCVQALLQAGADVSHVDKTGWTALVWVERWFSPYLNGASTIDLGLIEAPKEWPLSREHFRPVSGMAVQADRHQCLDLLRAARNKLLYVLEDILDESCEQSGDKRQTIARGEDAHCAVPKGYPRR